MVKNTANQIVPSYGDGYHQSRAKEGPGLTGESADHAGMAAHFLRSVFTGHEKGFLVLFHTPSDKSIFIPLNRESWPDDAAKSAMASRDRENVYFGIGLHGSPSPLGRGKEANVTALPGLWVDIDVLGRNHKAQNLPPSVDDALSIIRDASIKPNAVVYTGGGIQCYWFFKEPLETATQQERGAAKHLTKAFQKFLKGIAARHGWAIDSTADLAKVLLFPEPGIGKQPPRRSSVSS